MNDRIIFYKYSEHIYETTIEKSYRDTNIPHNIYIDVLKEISDISMKTLIVIMNLLIEDNVITGETAEERYEKFNIYSGTVEFYKIFKDLAPNLVDRATKVVKNKIESYLRVKERLYNDKNEIYSIFGIEFEKNSQFKFDFNISDVHNGEENIVIENNNKKIIYKPRGAYLDEFWNNIIKWINRKTGRDEIYCVSVLNKNNYSWYEYIEFNNINDFDKIKKYYYNFGILSCLAYILDMGDLHMENIIFSDKGPIIVDLETLFQILIKENGDSMNEYDYFEDLICNSVLKTALFPCSNWINNSDIDISGVTGKGGQIAKNAGLILKNSFTDKMSLNIIDEELNWKKNIPFYKNEPVDPKRFKEYILEGFEECYKIILENKSEFKKMVIKNKNLNLAKIRVVFHNTQIYKDIIDFLTLPSNSINSDKNLISTIVDKLCKDKEDLLKRDIYSNIQKGYIPIYYGKFKSNEVKTYKGESCYIHYTTPCEQFNRKVDLLGYDDLKFQKEIIRLTLLNFRGKTYNKEFSIKNCTKTDSVINYSVIEEMISDIKKRIVSKAKYYELDSINWITVENKYPNWNVKFQDTSLYGGLSGNAVFFAGLYKIDKDKETLDTLNKILFSINLIYKKQIKDSSVFTGTLSIAYLYLLLYNLKFNENYKDMALKVIIEHSESILKNEKYDYLDGVSGILVLLLQAYKISQNNKIWELIDNIKNKIMKNIIDKDNILYWGSYQILTGLAHGAAGISYALYKLYLQKEDENVLKLIKKLINYENMYFNNYEQNWGDITYEYNMNLDNTAIQWCHGAVGIGLARLKLNKIINVNEDIEKAKEITIKRGLYKENDSICHGNFGNLSFLIELYKTSGDRVLKKIIYYRLVEIYENSTQLYKSGLSKDFESVDFMLGLSGMGYECLRLKTDLPVISLLEI